MSPYLQPVKGRSSCLPMGKPFPNNSRSTASFSHVVLRRPTNTFEEQKFITILDTKNYRANSIWLSTANPLCPWVISACPSLCPTGKRPYHLSFCRHPPLLLRCQPCFYLILPWKMSNSRQAFKPLLTLKFISISSLKAGFCAWTLLFFCLLNELIYRPVLSRLFTMLKTSLNFTVSLHPVLCFPQYPCKCIQRVFTHTTYETFSTS